MSRSKHEIPDYVLESAKVWEGRSASHQWEDHEQAEYDLLDLKGRRLYDALRTGWLVRHYPAWVAAMETHGPKHYVVLEMDAQMRARGLE
jgi:hypothetical protein